MGSLMFWSSRQTSRMRWAGGMLLNRCSFRHWSRSRPIRLSTKPRCIGLPGAMSCQATPRSCCQARIAWEVSSVPVVAGDHQRQAGPARRSGQARGRRAGRSASGLPSTPGTPGLSRGPLRGSAGADLAQHVRGEVEAPALVRRLRDRQRRPRVERTLAIRVGPEPCARMLPAREPGDLASGRRIVASVRTGSRASFIPGRSSASPSNTRLGSRVREYRTCGSVPGGAR